MKLKDLLYNIDIIKMNVDLDIQINGICYDSRTANPGDVFIAIRGYEVDGHKYISKAIEKGAICVICEESPEVEANYLIVKNSRVTLAVISANWFGNPADQLKIIGATGTNGKTTTTTLIKNILEKSQDKKVGLIGTNGNYIGNKEYITSLTTPQSYDIQKLLKEMVNENCNYVVMEVSSHALMLDRVYGIKFETGIFTNLSHDHLDFHDTMDKYAEAKSRLFLMCRNSIINIDEKYAFLMINNTTGNIYTYSIEDSNADLFAEDISLKPDKVVFTARFLRDTVKVNLNIPGLFSVYNALSAILAVLLTGVELSKAAELIAGCCGIKGRVEVVPVDTDYTVLIDYAVTPGALKNVITMAKQSTKGRVVVLFGCGGDRDNSKRPEMGRIAAEFSDFIIVTTDNPRTEDPTVIIKQILAGMTETKTPYKVIPNRKEAIFWALENSQKDDILILAGKGHETYQIIGKIKNHMDEREIIADYFKTT